MSSQSYAEAASKGPKQTPEEAAAPQPPQIELSESASTASLVDVDMPSVRTVPSDFLEQEVKTETQAQRLEREAATKLKKAEAEAALAKKKAAAKARKADSWITNHFASMSDEASSALVVANFAAVIGISGFLGFKAYRLYDAGRLNWSVAGIGAGIVGAVAVVEGVFGRYFYKARGKKN
ncbi:hypothetical protein GQ53DRAFT_753213 [Thozetella sp. PMI_491]|nr:hypothetical protein GQ53DRAFT_753213 [Thozetella sp. PMI_491]